MNNCYRKDSSFKPASTPESAIMPRRLHPAHDLLERAKDDNTNINVLYYLGRACSKTSWKEDGVTYLNCRKLAMPSDSVMSACNGACGLLQDGISIHRPGEYPSDAIRKYDRQKHKLLYDAALSIITI